MTPAEITKLLEHQRAVSQHVANLHKITGKEARGNYLRNAVKDDDLAAGMGLGTRIAARFAGDGLNEPLPELKGQGPQAITLAA